jgi:hypothetical protein
LLRVEDLSKLRNRLYTAAQTGATDSISSEIKQLGEAEAWVERLVLDQALEKGLDEGIPGRPHRSSLSTSGEFPLPIFDPESLSKYRKGGLLQDDVRLNRRQLFACTLAA